MKKFLVFSLGLILTGPSVLAEDVSVPDLSIPDTSATTVSFTQQPLRFRLSYETLKMTGEPHLGMLGIGADFFLMDKLPGMYLTLNSYSAIVGERPGLITFGAGAGYLQPLFHSPLALDAGIFVGGGGGGGAPDGGGLITRGHLNLSYQLRNVSVFGGYSRLDFPTGEMGSHNFNVGLSFSSVFRTARHGRGNNLAGVGVGSRGSGGTGADSPENRQASRGSKADSPAEKSSFRVNLLGLNYLKFTGTPTLDNGQPAAGGGEIYLMGVELDKFFHEKWYAALKLHGAVAGGIDGYMSYLVGLGFEQGLGTEKLKVDAQLLAGPSGGGGVATGGGAIVQAAVGLRAHLGNAYDLKTSLGQTLSPGGRFQGTFLELSLSKSFRFVSAGNGPESTYQLGTADHLQQFGFEIINRTYFPPDLLDKSGHPYDRSFNLLGFQFSKKIHKNFEALGATYWAYQGSYGAYAEGLLGLGYRYEFVPGWALGAQVLVGAAGGGGIDLGSGLVFQYSAGLCRALSENWGITVNAGQMQGFRGNFNPYFVDAGIAYRFSQVAQR